MRIDFILADEILVAVSSNPLILSVKHGCIRHNTIILTGVSDAPLAKRAIPSSMSQSASSIRLIYVFHNTPVAIKDVSLSEHASLRKAHNGMGRLFSTQKARRLIK